MISSRSLRYVFIWGIAHMRYDFLCSFPYICIYCNLDGLSISSHQSFTLSSHSCDEKCPKCPQVTLLLLGDFNSCSIKHFLCEFQQCFRFQIYPRFFFNELVDIFCHFETHPTRFGDFSLFQCLQRHQPEVSVYIGDFDFQWLQQWCYPDFMEWRCKVVTPC